jgi:hypothetical protein
VKEMQKQKLKEIKYLLQVDHIPLMNVVKRMKISYHSLRALVKHDFEESYFLKSKSKRKERFAKIHERARNRIANLIINA